MSTGDRRSPAFRRRAVVALAIVASLVVAPLVRALRMKRTRRPATTRDAVSLRTALDAGEMGTWYWDLATGRVEWDAQLEALYGLEPGSFDGTFERYQSLLHPDDRAAIRAAVDQGMRTGTAWRFDHRVVWPNGSVHWVEGRGEPVRDDTGTVVGGTGVAINIDARVAAQAERETLLAAEREARLAGERATASLRQLHELTLALAGAVTIEEVAHTAVHEGMKALGADHGWFGVLDESGRELVTTAHAGFPPGALDAYGRIPIEAPLPAPEAVRTGTAILIESPEDRRRRYAHVALPEQHGAVFVVPITTGERFASVVSFGFVGPRSFSDDDRRSAATVVEACGQAVKRAASLQSEQAVRSRLRTLLEFSEALATLDEPQEVFDVTARFAAERIGRFARAYAVEGSSLRRAAVAHQDPLVEVHLRNETDAAGEPSPAVRAVAASGRAVLLRDLPRSSATRAPDLQRTFDVVNPTSGLIVPMRISGRTVGVLAIGDDRDAPLGESDLELALDLGRRSASAVERTTLWQASLYQLAVEHHMVEVLQRSIVPERLPDVPGVGLSAAYRPADVRADVGGDWYDAFVLEHLLLLVVGDVAGHGIDAASLMGRVRNALRAYAVEDAEPARLLTRVDTMLRELEPGAMVTAVVASFEPEDRRLRFARAGHPPPVVVSDAGGATFLDEANAPPLGTLGHAYESANVVLEAGARALFYTDGLVERRGRSIDDGFEWLAERAASLCDEPLDAFCERLVREAFSSEPSLDDICTVALHVKP